MKILISFLLITMTCFESFSQNKDLIYLWPGKVPGESKEKLPLLLLLPKMTILSGLPKSLILHMQVFLPEKSLRNGAAVIVCPGGGYHILAWDLEGTEVAAWLNKNGYAAFVLQYRVPDKKAGALQDVQRAIRIIRRDASKYGVDPEKIGVMGFSAGGSLTARASTLYNKQSYSPVDKADSLSCRPSFSMLIYPAYLDQGPELSLTPELKLSGDMPPIFIFQTSDDQYGNSAIVMAQHSGMTNFPLNCTYCQLEVMATDCGPVTWLLKHGRHLLKNGFTI